MGDIDQKTINYTQFKCRDGNIIKKELEKINLLLEELKHSGPVIMKTGTQTKTKTDSNQLRILILKRNMIKFPEPLVSETNCDPVSISTTD
jgi:hypothetical protein